ncbi:MAG: HD domain-containing phosphohydrolase [Dehalococcoidia bacterium]|nr:HD domain-containing phosphohydrolase [Dehalococcoidia bacterium]
MRRILVKYAKPGMVLARDLHDGSGHVAIGKGTQLTDRWVQALAYLGASELVILDERFQDVSVSPMIPPELEGMVSEALRDALAKIAAAVSAGAAACPVPDRDGVSRGAPAATQPSVAASELPDLGKLRQLVYQMVQQLYPELKGDPTITGWHSWRDAAHILPVKIAGLCLLLGKEAEMSESDLVDLGMAALLQNAGYAVIKPPELAERPGALWEEMAFINAWRTDNGGLPMAKVEPLTESELQIVWKHPLYGADILRQCNGINDSIRSTIVQHHERWNGSGYPYGLKGTEILLPARILGMCDALCTTVSKKPYRQPFQPYEATELVVACSRVLYDPDLVQLFLENVPAFPTGVMVKLNGGEVGIVVDANLGLVGRPKVRVCYDKDGNQLATPYEVDLAEDEHANKLVTSAVEY